MGLSKTRAAERPGKNQFLLGRREKAKAVGALDLHSHILYQPCEKGAAIPLPPQVGSFLAGFL